jgi:hypothetical protein
MKANELRIGNWVQINNQEWPNLKGVKFKVTSIECNALMLYSIRGIGNSNYNQYDYNIEPIPLTEEWLLKFGFASNPYQDRYEKGVLHIECDKTKGYLQLWCEQLPQAIFIKYVHQLQNLYFALTGQELTYGGNK